MAPIRPHAPQPSEAQAQLIDDLGGPKAVAELVSKRIGMTDNPLVPQTCSMWKKRGIPFRYRAPLAIEAREQGISVPADFLGAGA